MLFVCLLAAALGLSPVIEAGRGELVSDLVLGSEDADGPTFLLPAVVRADSHGNLFVLEAKDKVILKFDPQGTLLRTFSGPGEGPGEMGQVWVMALDARDRVVIWDHAYKRFTAFDDDGELLDTVPYQPMVSAMERGLGGTLYVEVHASDFTRRPPPTMVRLVRLSSDLDHPVPIDSTQIVESMVIQSSGGGATSVTLPYVEGLAWAVTPDGGVVVGCTGDDQLTWYDADLKPIRERRLRAERIATDDADRERYLRSFHTDDERFLDLVRQRVPFPDHKPWFAGVFCDEEGNVLVSRYDDAEDGVLYEVFSPQGDPLGDVILPSLHGADLRHGFVYRARRRGDALPEVCRFRLEPATE
jgi:hypothetical protein